MILNIITIQFFLNASTIRPKGFDQAKLIMRFNPSKIGIRYVSVSTRIYFKMSHFIARIENDILWLFADSKDFFLLI